MLESDISDGVRTRFEAMIIQSIRNAIGREKTKFLRMLGFIRNDWRSGLGEETQFWENALRYPEKHWVMQEYLDRTNPALPLQSDLQALIDSDASETIEILDVGAGPLTRIGKTSPNHQVRIVATDPLADKYDDILKSLSLEPIVRTVNVEGERLRETFAEESFDFACATNSLDHAHDPASIIRQMFAIVKQGGSVYLWHFEDSGIGERYKGLHQWNFRLANNDMLISDGRRVVRVSEILPSTALIRTRKDAFRSTPVVVCVITKAKQDR